MIARLLLRACNAIVNLVLVLALLVSGAYAVYALWDNNQVFSAAEDVQADMIKLKPVVDTTGEETDNSEAFAELMQINSDVCGWISMDNTKIDYPILHGEDNLTYINKDVYGNFALAGSIYLDSRNTSDFTDPYSLLYGHHMADSRMFGDLDLYKDKDFFKENTTGTLITPDGAYELEVFSVLLVGASEDNIFDPTLWTDDNISQLYSYVKSNSLHYNEAFVEGQISGSAEHCRILCLSTCSSEYTDARTIVLAAMRPYASGETGGLQE